MVVSIVGDHHHAYGTTNLINGRKQEPYGKEDEGPQSTGDSKLVCRAQIRTTLSAFLTQTRNQAFPRTLCIEANNPVLLEDGSYVGFSAGRLKLHGTCVFLDLLFMDRRVTKQYFSDYVFNYSSTSEIPKYIQCFWCVLKLVFWAYSWGQLFAPPHSGFVHLFSLQFSKASSAGTVLQYYQDAELQL